MGRVKHKVALCEGRVVRSEPLDGGTYQFVVAYTPVSPLNHYKIHQYFLAESMA
jgi:hypothetical protein